MDIENLKSSIDISYDGLTVPLIQAAHEATRVVTVPMELSLHGNGHPFQVTPPIRADKIMTMSIAERRYLAVRPREIEAFFVDGKLEGNIRTPDDQEIREVYSRLYHMLKHDNPHGAWARGVIEEALKALKLGEVLPDGPGAKSRGASEPSRG